MKNLLLFLACIGFGITVHGQQLEAGFLVGYGADNIGDYESDASRTVIGDPLWGATYGVSALYYMKSPGETPAGRVGVILQHSTKGSVSEIYPDSRFSFTANTIGAFGGVAADVWEGLILYLDGGFGYTFIDNHPFYRGRKTQEAAFQDLYEEISIRDHQIAFLLGLGIEKNLTKNILKVFLGVTGDAGISKVNDAGESFRTLGLWASGGVRYLIPLKKRE